MTTGITSILKNILKFITFIVAVVAVDLTAKLPELKLSEDNGIDEAYIPINYCPICGRNLRKDK